VTSNATNSYTIGMVLALVGSFVLTLITLSFFFLFLQFRLAFVAPESRVVGAGELVDDPKKIALNYIRGFFFVDLFVVLPLPQVRALCPLSSPYLVFIHHCLHKCHIHVLNVLRSY
jgi:hypothetical protein